MSGTTPRRSGPGGGALTKKGAFFCKANVVADALSRKSRGALASIASREWRMLETVGQFGL